MSVINTDPMSVDRAEQMADLFTRLQACNSVDHIVRILQRELKCDQDKYDLCTRHLNLGIMHNGFIGHLLLNVHNSRVSVVPALEIIDCEAVNVFDMAIVTSNPPRHLMFDVVSDGTHIVNPASFEYMCSKISNLNLSYGAHNLASYSLQFLSRKLLKIMIDHGLDMNAKNGYGYSGNDYLTPVKGVYQMRLNDEIARDIIAHVVARDLAVERNSQLTSRNAARHL